jgi:hypothetical protein
VIADAVWAALSGNAAATALAGDRDRAGRSSTIAVGLIWLALSGASALHGMQTVPACRTATAALEARRAVPGPPPLTSQPPGP